MWKLRLREVQQLAQGYLPCSLSPQLFLMCCPLCLENATSLFLTVPPYPPIPSAWITPNSHLSFQYWFKNHFLEVAAFDLQLHCVPCSGTPQSSLITCTGTDCKTFLSSTRHYFHDGHPVLVLFHSFVHSKMPAKGLAY